MKVEQTSNAFRSCFLEIQLMFPWVRDHLTDVWNKRKSSRTLQRPSLNQSPVNAGGSKDTHMTTNAADAFSVNVISLEGTSFSVTATQDNTVDRIKSLAIEHFYGHTKSPAQFRLVNASIPKILSDDQNLQEEEIDADDELLLVEIRISPMKETLTEDALKGPSLEDILEATNDLPITNPSKPRATTDCPADFQNEMRKILVTLVQASAKILMHSPEAVKFYEILRERLDSRLKPPNDPKSVKYLVDMGFSEKKVLKALRLRKMNTSEALEWLLEHEDDIDEEDDLQLPPLDADVDAAGPSTKGNHQKKEPNLVHVVALLLESFRQFQKLEFKPSPSLIAALEDMGFKEQQIIETLKITGNNQSNACEWLIGERRPSLQNLNLSGLDPEGAIYKAIMSNPHIQLSLTNPKLLLAYLSMLETPTSTTIWAKDPEVAPVLSQIFKTYHSEKHVIHMNRFEAS